MIDKSHDDSCHSDLPPNGDNRPNNHLTERFDDNQVNENKSENDFVGFGDSESFPSARLIELLKH